MPCHSWSLSFPRSLFQLILTSHLVIMSEFSPSECLCSHNFPWLDRGYSSLKSEKSILPISCVYVFTQCNHQVNKRLSFPPREGWPFPVLILSACLQMTSDPGSRTSDPGSHMRQGPENHEEQHPPFTQKTQDVEQGSRSPSPEWGLLIREESQCSSQLEALPFGGCSVISV